MTTNNKISLRLTHPTLYKSARTFAWISIGLGLNFLLTKPTFNPYQIDKHITGSIFLLLGIAKFVAITYLHNLRVIRTTMALCVAFMIFWGIGTSLTFFSKQTSLQLFVLYIGLVRLQYIWMMEPYANPLTGSNGDLGKSDGATEHTT